jgi:hypothetical protein
MAKKGVATKSSSGTPGKRVREALAAVSLVRPPEIPVDKLLGEARALGVASKRHQAVLAKVGMPASLLALLDGLVEALAEAQGRCVATRKTGRTVTEVKVEEAARLYRQRTLEDLAFALDGQPDADERIAKIREGEGLDDLVADLAAIVAYVEEASKSLSAIGQNPKKLAKEGASLEGKLSFLVSERRSHGDETSLTGERDRAATALSAVMLTIRKAGKYAFRDEPNKSRLFSSSYTRIRKAVYRAKQTKAQKKAASGASNGEAL